MVVVFTVKAEKDQHLPGGCYPHIYSVPNKHWLWLPSPALARGHRNKVIPGCSPSSLRTRLETCWLKLGQRGGKPSFSLAGYLHFWRIPPRLSKRMAWPFFVVTGQEEVLGDGSGADRKGPRPRGSGTKQIFVNNWQFLSSALQPSGHLHSCLNHCYFLSEVWSANQGCWGTISRTRAGLKSHLSHLLGRLPDAHSLPTICRGARWVYEDTSLLPLCLPPIRYSGKWDPKLPRLTQTTESQNKPQWRRR